MKGYEQGKVRVCMRVRLEEECEVRVGEAENRSCGGHRAGPMGTERYIYHVPSQPGDRVNGLGVLWMRGRVSMVRVTGHGR